MAETKNPRMTVERISDMKNRYHILADMRSKQMLRMLSILPDVLCADLQHIPNIRDVFQKMDDDRMFNNMTDDAFALRLQIVDEMDMLWCEKDLVTVTEIIANATDFGRLLQKYKTPSVQDPFDLTIDYFTKMDSRGVLKPDHIEEEEPEYTNAALQAMMASAPTTLAPKTVIPTASRYV